MFYVVHRAQVEFNAAIAACQMELKSSHLNGSSNSHGGFTYCSKRAAAGSGNCINVVWPELWDYVKAEGNLQSSTWKPLNAWWCFRSLGPRIFEERVLNKMVCRWIIEELLFIIVFIKVLMNMNIYSVTGDVNEMIGDIRSGWVSEWLDCLLTLWMCNRELSREPRNCFLFH